MPPRIASLAMAEPSPTTTPKRKRGEELPITPIKFSFDPSKTEPSEDGNSPRTAVAHRFRGLALGGGGGVAGDEPDDVEAADATRKRQRPDEDMKDGAEAGDAAVEGEPSETSPPRPQPDVAIASTEPTEETPRRALPIVELPPEHKSPGRRRAGTPPLRLKKSPGKDRNKADAEEPSVADPVRAALTWHEDEITIYDPDDDDDDGTGINGVGFKPTPALAQARAMKRRQQMAEYRRREENEARAKRSQRRRGETPTPSGGVVKKRSPTRKVRFIDAETQKITITTI